LNLAFACPEESVVERVTVIVARKVWAGIDPRETSLGRKGTKWSVVGPDDDHVYFEGLSLFLPLVII
jgi:hypothetical protein